MNVPKQHAPRTWDDYQGQSHIVQRVRNWIAKNQFHSSILITGGTGTGKTSLVQLMIKATHCLNRQPNESTICDQCKNCKSPLSNPYRNVIWVDPMSSQVDDDRITYQSKIKDALLSAQQGPTVTDSPHRDILFVVFDEAQLLPRDLLQQAMVQAELVSPKRTNVVYVFITMAPERFDPKVLEALQHRGATLELKPPSTDQLVSYLQRIYPDKPTASLELIAKRSSGSYRGALSTLQNCLEYDPELKAESLPVILSYVPTELRWELWVLLRQKAFITKIKEIVDQAAQYASSYQFVEQLIEDIMYHEGANHEHVLFGLRTLTEFLHSDQPNLLPVYLKQLCGLNLINLDTFSQQVTNNA